MQGIKSRRSPQPPRNRRAIPAWLAWTILLLIWGALAAALFLEVVQVRAEAFDFRPRWIGARAMLRGRDPYAIEILRQLPSPEGVVSVPDDFLYPATITYILLPFWLLDWPVAVSLWSGLQLLLILVAPLLVFEMLGYKPKPIGLGLVVLLSIVGYRHSMNAVVLGQFVNFALAAVVVAAYAIQRRRTWLAVLGLVCTSVRPEGMVMVSLICLWLLASRRLDVLPWFILVMSGLLALSLAQLGNWLPDFLAGIILYAERGEASHALGYLGPAAWAAGSLVLVWAGWMLRSGWPLPDRSRLLGWLAIVVVALMLVLPQTKDYTLVYLLLPLWLLIGVGHDRSWVMAGASVLLISPWLYELARTALGVEHTVQQLLSPLSTGVLLTAVLKPSGESRR